MWVVSREKCRFPLPDVPPGWTPNPKSLWASEDPEKENLQLPRPPSAPEPHGKSRRSNISADQVSIHLHVTYLVNFGLNRFQRGAILGETPLPPASPFKPTSGALASRFTSETPLPSASPFKPISGAMASRFTSAAVVDFGLHTQSHEEIAAKEAQRLKEDEDKVSPKAHAAKMGMFGPLTRETRPWQPVSRLCKRFGVKVPELPDMPNEASSSKADTFFPQSKQTVPATVEKDYVVPVQKADGPRDLANIGLGEDETQGQDTLTYERPSMDIFKAIFASDDESSDDEQEKEPELDEQPDLPPSSTNRSSLVGLVTDDIPVDLSTFKPTFIPREDKSNRSKDKEKSKAKSKEKKEKKEKKGALVSFAMDDDSTEANTQPKQSKDRPKKKKRKDKKEGEGDDDVAMWVDKPPPEVINSTTSTTTDTLKSRKRAIDFM